MRQVLDGPVSQGRDALGSITAALELEQPGQLAGPDAIRAGRRKGEPFLYKMYISLDGTPIRPVLADHAPGPGVPHEFLPRAAEDVVSQGGTMLRQRTLISEHGSHGNQSSLFAPIRGRHPLPGPFVEGCVVPRSAASWYVACKSWPGFRGRRWCCSSSRRRCCCWPWLLVKLTSRGPALYVQMRIGRNGKPFPIYKIRTMYLPVREDCPACNGPSGRQPRSCRSAAGSRRTHIDELPQLWNVIRGDMSLIGPRPERPEFVPQLEQAISHYRQRLLLRPGVTGLAQVQLPPDTDLNSVRTKLAYDLYYLRHMSFWLDVRIFAATCFKMLAVPFAVIRRCFAFPPEKDVLAAYHE